MTIMAALSKYNFIRDDFSPIIQLICYIGMLTVIILGLKQKESADEYARLILGKIDSICITFIMIILMILAAFIGGPMFKKYSMTRDDISMLLCLILVIITTLKAFLFLLYNRRGI